MVRASSAHRSRDVDKLARRWSRFSQPLQQPTQSRAERPFVFSGPGWTYTTRYGQNASPQPDRSCELRPFIGRRLRGLMRNIGLAIAASVVLFSGPASAEPTLQDYNRTEGDERALFDIYLQGFLAGLTWSDVITSSRGQVPTFCPPPNLVITPSQLIDIIERYDTANTHVTDADLITHLSVLALPEVFPCEGGSAAALPSQSSSVNR